jgi:SAM-dependent methyltransferase
MISNLAVRTALTLCVVATCLFLPASAEYKNTLERLGYLYGSDKSHDDHKYVDVYETLFNHMVDEPVQLLEVGVSLAQSLQMWHDYFPKGQLVGMDVWFFPKCLDRSRQMERLKLYQCDLYNTTETDQIPFKEESFDIIIEDALHDRISQEIGLEALWKFLKPGGIYVVEDVDALDGGLVFEEEPHLLRNFTRTVMQENHAFFIDTHVGARNHFEMMKASTRKYMRDYRLHNSYLLVIRKRIGPLPPVLMNTGKRAMQGRAVLNHGGAARPDYKHPKREHVTHGWQQP